MHFLSVGFLVVLGACLAIAAAPTVIAILVWVLWLLGIATAIAIVAAIIWGAHKL